MLKDRCIELAASWRDPVHVRLIVITVGNVSWDVTNAVTTKLNRKATRREFQEYHAPRSWFHAVQKTDSKGLWRW
jgi:hypothetical protein